MTDADTIADCPSEAEIQAFVEGGGDRDRIRAHIDVCEACRELLAELTRRSVPPTRTEGEIVGGRYRVVRRVGRGGMGEVVEAVRIDLGDRVALKRIRASALDEDARKRFLFEAKALAAVTSPFVVRIVDFGARDGEESWLAMEYLEGSTLAALIEGRGPLADAELVPIALQLLAGLEAAHAAGVLHRDVKPSNVVVQDGGIGGTVVKLVDFGLARAVVPGSMPLTSPEQTLGTPGYMSPEQIAGEADVDARADIYAVGATLFAAATGSAPDPLASPQDLASKLDADARISRSTRSVLLRALRSSREDRFRDARSMAEALKLPEPPSDALTARDPASPKRASASSEDPAASPPARRAAIAVDSHTLASATPDVPGARRSNRMPIVWIAGGVMIVAAAAYVGRSGWSSSSDRLPAPTSSATPSASVPPVSTPSSGASASANMTQPSLVDASEPIAKPSHTVVAACVDGARIPDGKCVGGKWRCSPGEEACGNKCVTLSADTKNCGACGKTCPSDEYCHVGVCVRCPQPLLICGDRCIDPTFDPFNCGTCGNICALHGKGRCVSSTCQ